MSSDDGDWTQEQIDTEVDRLELGGSSVSTVVEGRPFIDGAYHESSTGWLESYNPATGQHVANIAACDSTHVDLAVNAARSAFESGVWSDKSPEERKNVLLKFAQLIEEHALELAVMDSIEGALRSPSS